MRAEIIKKEIIELILNLFIDQGFMVEDIEYLDFIEDVGIDSITFISMVVELELHFDIEVSDELLTLDNFKDIEHIVSIVMHEIETKNKRLEVKI